MKKLLTIILCFVTVSLFSQTAEYKEIKALLLSEGYEVSTEQYADLAQGETAGHTKTFYEGNDYIIVAVSDDDDVSDVDIYLNYTNGDNYDKDTSVDNSAILTFSPSFTREMRVVIKNYASSTPTYQSRCRFIIAYK